jgi:F-type H+-transporting ATPase subunit a
MNVLEHLYQQRPVIPLELWGIDISITGPVLTLWLAVAVVFWFYYAASRSLKPVPGRLQSLAEVLVLFLRDEVAAQISHDRKQWLIFLTVIFSFVLANNLLGLIPGLSGSTANINVTATLAVIVFLVVQVSGMVKHGPVRYFRSFVPPGVPLIVSFFMVPVELVSQLAKPFSLALRLFANMFAGHAVMLLILSLIFIFRSYLILPLPVLGNTIILIFEVFVCFIQAFVFTYLSALYIATALEGH